MIEWCASSIVYMEREEFTWLKEILPQHFSVKKGLFHYWHMASTNYREYLKGDMVRAKKYFYVFRPILAAKWILDRKQAPPMLFDELVETQSEETFKPELEKLLKMKKAISELGMAPRIQVFNDYIERVMQEIEEMAEPMEEKKVEWLLLNDLFLRIVRN